MIPKSRISYGLLIVLLMLSGCDRLTDTADLLKRINALEQALATTQQQIEQYRQQETEYRQQIEKLQSANQQLLNKHKHNLDALFQ